MLFTFKNLLNLKGRRVDRQYRQSTYEKENYKNNVGCIIFMVIVYPKNVRVSCLSYEKIMNEYKKIYE